MPLKNKQAGKEKNFSWSHPRRLFYSFLLIVSILIGLAAVHFLRNSGSITSGQYKDYNVLLITIDTLRADHLPVYGYRDVKTPSIDRLASESLVFEDVVAHVPFTLPSHASILTGLLPIYHGVRDSIAFLDPQITTIAEIFRSQGYFTAAFVSAFVLDSSWQLDQGFEVYFDNFDLSQEVRLPHRRAEETEKELEPWLTEMRNKKFFLWVHYYDPHSPYDPPEPFRSQYADRPYDGEIAYTDSVLGKLFSKLEELELKDRTLIILTADHGEGLGEHAEKTHGVLLYDATLQVPLLLYLPEKKAGRVEGLVRQIDIVPTILELVGFPAASPMQGKSLIPLIQGKEKQERVCYSESLFAELHYGWSPLMALSTRQYRFIEAPKAELYDRNRDPVEIRNLIQENASTAKVLQGRLHEIVRTQSRDLSKGTQRIDPEAEEKLRALGYVGRTVASTTESRQIDPKDKMHLVRSMREAFVATEQNNHRQALQLITPVLKEDPEMIDAHLVAGIAHAGIGEFDLAVAEFTKALQLKPDAVNALYRLANVHDKQGNFQQAEYWYLRVLKYDSRNVETKQRLASLYNRFNQKEKAKPYFAEVIRFHTESLERTRSSQEQSTVLLKLGEIHFSAGEIDRAEENLKSAAQLTPDRPMIHFNLAVMHQAKGDFEQAASEYIKETQLDPSNIKAFTNLGILYRRFNQLNDSIDCFQAVLRIKPRDTQASFFLAEAYLEAGRNLEEALSLARTAAEQNPGSQQAKELLSRIEKMLKKS